METVTLHPSVIVTPEVLTDNVHKHVTDKVIQRYLNKSSEQEGVIIHVHNVQIISNIVQRDNIHIKFYVALQVDRVLPKIGLVIPAEVLSALEHGLFLNYHGVSILVPKSTFQGQFIPAASPGPGLPMQPSYYMVDGVRIYPQDVVNVRVTKFLWTPAAVPTGAQQTAKSANAQGRFSVIAEFVQ